MEHIPVLLPEILDMFRDTEPPIENYFDGTFGRGGHARAVLEEFQGVRVFAMDQDLDAIAHCKKEFADLPVQIVHAPFEEFEEKFSEENRHQDFFDIMLLDLGVSSPQLDRAERGFSFYNDGPLDMRMNQEQELTAAEVVNNFDEDELNEIFQELGEVRKPFRVTRAVVADRKEKPFETTRQFAGLIERIEGWSNRGHHPATKYFMALRLYVNRELEQVQNVLPKMMKALRPNGRLAVITFHSLEDRIVKYIFKNNPELGKPVNKKVIQAKWEDKKRNPRARSAKLRVFQKSAQAVGGEV